MPTMRQLLITMLIIGCMVYTIVHLIAFGPSRAETCYVKIEQAHTYVVLQGKETVFKDRVVCAVNH